MIRYRPRWIIKIEDQLAVQCIPLTPQARRAARIPRFHHEFVKFLLIKKNSVNAMDVAATAIMTLAMTWPKE